MEILTVVVIPDCGLDFHFVKKLLMLNIYSCDFGHLKVFSGEMSM